MNASTRTNSLSSAPILLVEDDPALREALEVTLAMEDIAYRAVESAEDALSAIQAASYRVLVSDIRLPMASGLALLIEARKLQPDLPVVLMTAYADASTAVEALRGGARDFLLKPFKPEQFIDVIKRYLPHGEWQAPIADGPVAVDPQSRQLLHKLDRVAQTDATVLLMGESGSGKEVMAQYLHQRSPRAKQSFVAINCAAIPSTLLEATLFGHERGAFTGASKSQPGKFELAQGGTIFLDEIGEMPLELQTKLLRVLQERQVERVGSHQTISLDVRVIAATNQDLAKRVAQGAFREDLFYRINVFPLRVPALRERTADILPLAERFLLKYRASMGQPEAKLSEAARARLLTYAWPGNVRELENAIQRALLLCDGIWIQPDDMALDLMPGPGSPAPGLDRAQGLDRARASDELPAGPWDTAPKATSAHSTGSVSVDSGSRQRYQDAPIIVEGEPTAAASPVLGDIKALERDHILAVLAKVGGSRRKAVQILGISERTLRYKLKTWRESGIPIP
ncbi:MAG: sigma-54-dependent Fis family transcriptional regulator [Betaproteobacteria bacterium]|nr:sigma-54-dependent Fis family transcriptional regulator [Betaproteobacteria bacterium]NBP39144.1 sigma-54-dependent Fis family transcriptional regulator [Betaproteobacteria bacterium]NBQ79481.1 sigma-54-dependent Fis family transcriptional regulator [Betaproteobacteria bacterium]NBS40208.1 sigma-54-dependent Fis family transcriptional regulator [Betaproteobacteria bacterium]NBT82561.1 sigma-54-dependent Fis family transcriptional regulator [Betaproteobacteria bacterium]